MKSYFIIILIIFSAAKSSCQNQDSLITDNKKWAISFVDASLLYPLTSDDKIKEYERKNGRPCPIMYPLLIVNNVIIRDKEKLNNFRNKYSLLDNSNKVKKFKYLSNEEAKKLGILNVPMDGVVLVYLKSNIFLEL